MTDSKAQKYGKKINYPQNDTPISVYSRFAYHFWPHQLPVRPKTLTFAAKQSIR